MSRKSEKCAESMLKVVMLGDGGVGKSCLMNAFVTEAFDGNSAHTIGVDFLKRAVQTQHSDMPTTLQIWDTAGQERYRSLRTPFYRGADACLLNFAVDDLASFESLRGWKNEFVTYSEIRDPARFPFIVIGNKIDLPNRKVSQEQANQWCVCNNMTYFETSSKVMLNVDLAFIAAANQALKQQLAEGGSRIRGGSTTINLTNKNSLNYKSNLCC